MIKSVTTRDFTEPIVSRQATEVETTHLFFNLSKNEAYIRQIFKGSGDDILGIRFLKVTGREYQDIELGVKIQKLADDIESNGINDVTIEEVERSDFLEATR